MASRPWFASNGPLWGLAVGVALAVVMILAILAPRLFGFDDVAWWITVAIGVVVGAAIVVWGYARRGDVDVDREAPRH